MPDTVVASRNETTEFVFRRLGEAFPLSTPETSPLLAYGVMAVLFLLFTASLIVPFLSGRKKAGNSGGFFGAMFSTALSILVGKIDDGRATLWHFCAAGCRAALFAWPLVFIIITRSFETEPELVWWIFTAGVLAIASALTILMYIRDARSVKFWAVPLALLRICVLCILAFCFLLPAYQTWEESTKTSRVVVLLDISPSMTEISDDVSRDKSVKLKSRIEKVIEFLSDEDVAFLSKLLAKNPVHVYRFGARLDEDSDVIKATQGDAKPVLWTKDEWDAFIKYDFKPKILSALPAEAQEVVKNARAWGSEPGSAEWFLSWSKSLDQDTGLDALNDENKELFKKVRDRIEKRIDVTRSIVTGTAMPDSLITTINRESTNMTQGLIVFSDGRSNIGTDSAMSELGKRAREANIPVFTVAVGEAREIVALKVSDLQAPPQTMPDEPTNITVAADGIGFREGDEVEAILELFLPGRDPKTDQPDHEMRKPIRFAAGEPPHGEVTFTLDPETFGESGPVALVEPAPPSKVGRKFQLKQGAWNVRAKIARDNRELYDEEFHLSPTRAMQVIDKPLRVLIVSSGPMREYQTLRSLLVRETDASRAELSIYLQNEGGMDGTIVQDVPPGRLLMKFPDVLEAGKQTGVQTGTDAGDATAIQRERFNNLDEYDVVVVFDPNWNEKDKSGELRIAPAVFRNLERFVTKFGGGLVYVAGPFYTPQMARNDEEAGRLRPIVNILPVVPDDIVATEDILIKIRDPKIPRRLKLTPSTEADLLRLDDESTLPEPDRATAGWENYFTGRDKFVPSGVPGEDLLPKRGFYSYYPIKQVKPGVTPLAEFLNVDDRGQEARRVFYATTQAEVGRTVWLGSGEIYRLRAANTEYYDRFWLKLLRYAAAKRNSGNKSRGQVLMSNEFIAGGPIRVQTRVLQANGEPYSENELDKPKFTIKQFDINGNMVKEHGPYDVLKPTKTSNTFEGYYKGQVTADTRTFPIDARYKLSVNKSDLPEPLEAEFTLKSSNPELDNPKPDFLALTNAASTLKDVLDRIADSGVRQEVSMKLGGNGKATDEAKAKLTFRLNETDKLSVLPECIRSETRSQRDRGLVDDLWDDEYDPAPSGLSQLLRRELVGPVKLWAPVALVVVLLIALFWVLRGMTASAVLGTLYTVGLLGLFSLLATVLYFGNPFPVGYVILAIVSLLGLEWITRKLTRLA